MAIKPSILWFREDLRLEDNPALMAAIEKGGAVIPIYIWNPEEEGEWSPGGASRWWLHYSLASLSAELEHLGLTLVIRKQSPLKALTDLIQETNADSVFWNRRYEPHNIQQDAYIKAELHHRGIKTQSFNSHLLFEPWTVLNKQNKPFQVFTPFWKQCLKLDPPPDPLEKPTKAKGVKKKLDSEPINNLGLLPHIRWDKGIQATWSPGAPGAQAALKEALTHVIAGYPENRDLPGIKGVSHLSPYLHFGEISPRIILHAVNQHFKLDDPAAAAFIRQIGWREFAYNLLYHFPHTPFRALRPTFDSFPWKNNYAYLRAWQKGQTGYPLVDAGMRELWVTGWMHNRVRLIVGSFLVKDLLIRWQEGAKWFWDTLVDADLANNTLGWQWIAGCGADAAPYFRIFNPITQGERFDPEGDYVRKWVPEIAALPNRWIHKPWEAPTEVLKQAGIVLGTTYPKPIVDHAQAREKALEAYAKL